MLDRIRIQNIGIIEDIEIEFDEYINILTGETGSGKTLIIDSINLVTGNRVNKDIIRNGEVQALIEICFNAEIPDVSEDRSSYFIKTNICKWKKYL